LPNRAATCGMSSISNDGGWLPKIVGVAERLT